MPTEKNTQRLKINGKKHIFRCSYQEEKEKWYYQIEVYYWDFSKSAWGPFSSCEEAIKHATIEACKRNPGVGELRGWAQSQSDFTGVELPPYSFSEYQREEKSDFIEEAMHHAEPIIDFKAYYRVEFIFGLMSDDGTVYAQKSWAKFVNEELVLRLREGFTIYHSWGFERDQTSEGKVVENSVTVVAYMRKPTCSQSTAAFHLLLRDICAEWRRRAKQREVLVSITKSLMGMG